MKFFKLDGSFKPSTTLAEFDSLVWTERYQPAGDFKITVENDTNILTTLPEGCLVSHTDTTEVMMVENHEIVRDKDKNLKITVTGRSVETFAENRPTSGSYQSVVDSGTGAAINEITASTPSCEAAVALLKGRLEPGTASAADAITNLLVRESVRVHDSAMAHPITRGDTYSQVLRLLQLSGTGIKVIRPNGAQTTMDIVVHDGLDKRTLVVFNAQDGDLDDTSYLRSIKKYKNYAQVAAHIYQREVRTRDLGADVTGFDRRVMYIEADELEGTYTPPAATDVISSIAQIYMDANKKISIVDATISITAKPKFKIDYDIGDLVSVYGEFSVTDTLRVTEHILTVDKNGIQGYPSLSAV